MQIWEVDPRFFVGSKEFCCCFCPNCCWPNCCSIVGSEAVEAGDAEGGAQISLSHVAGPRANPWWWSVLELRATGQGEQMSRLNIQSHDNFKDVVSTPDATAPMSSDLFSLFKMWLSLHNFCSLLVRNGHGIQNNSKPYTNWKRNKSQTKNLLITLLVSKARIVEQEGDEKTLTRPGDEWHSYPWEENRLKNN